MQGLSRDLQICTSGWALHRHEARQLPLPFRSFRPALMHTSHRCCLVYLLPSERTPFRPTLSWAHAACTYTGDNKDSASRADEAASTSNSASLRASIWSVSTATNAMKFDTASSRSRHFGMRCRQARYESTKEAPNTSSCMRVAHDFVFHVSWNLSMCWRCRLCLSTHPATS